MSDKLPVSRKAEAVLRPSPSIPDLLAEAAPDEKSVSLAPIANRVGIPTIYMLLGNLFTLALGLPLQIYVARVLGPENIGIYGLLEVAMGTVASLLGFGMGVTVMRFVPEHLARREYGEAVALVKGGALLLFANGVVAYIALLVLLRWIDTLWPWTEAYRREIGIMGLMIPLSLLSYFVQQALRGFQEIRSIAVGSSILQLVMKALLTVGAFAVGWRLDGYMLASVLASLCGLIWLSYSLAKQVRALPAAAPTISPVRKWLSFALADYSQTIVLSTTSGVDRYLLAAFSGSSAVGVLVVIRQLLMLPDRFNQMLLVIGAPLFSAAHGADDRAERQHIYHLMTDWVVRASLPLVLFLWLFGWYVLNLYGREFADEGIAALRILVVAGFFNLICGPVGNLAMMSGLEWQLVRLWTVNTVILVIALIVLVPLFGLIGVALAGAISIVASNVPLLILVGRKLGVVWWNTRYLEWLPQCAAALAVASIALLLRSLNLAELVMFLIAMYAAAIGVTFLRGWHADDIQLFGRVRQAMWQMAGRQSP